MADLTAFVLGDLDGAERAEVVAHLEGCDACRAEVAALTGTLDRLSALAPGQEPSAGFVARTVSSLPPPTVARWSRRRPVVAAAALAAAACLVAGIIGYRISGGARPHAPGELAVAELRTQDGREVGQAVVFDEHPALVTVALTVPDAYGLPAGTVYRVEAIPRGGGPVGIGTLELVAGQATWHARVRLSPADIATVRIVGPGGHDLCAGLVPPGG